LLEELQTKAVLFDEKLLIETVVAGEPFRRKTDLTK
jgi:hypothetical protein